MTEGVYPVEWEVVSVAQALQPVIGRVAVDRQPTAYTITIILYLRDITHKVVEYLDLACFGFLVFFIDIDLVNEIS